MGQHRPGGQVAVAQNMPASRFRPARIARAVGYGALVAILAPAALAFAWLVMMALMLFIQTGSLGAFGFAVMTAPLFTLGAYILTWPWGLAVGISSGTLFLLRGDFAHRIARKAERRTSKLSRPPPRLSVGRRLTAAGIVIVVAPLLPALVYTGATLGYPFPPIAGWEAYLLSLILAAPGAALFAFVSRDRVLLLNAAWTQAPAWALTVANAGHEMDELLMLAIVATAGAALAGLLAKQWPSEARAATARIF